MKMLLRIRGRDGYNVDTSLDVDFGTRGEDIVLRVTTTLGSPKKFELSFNHAALEAAINTAPVFRDDPPRISDDNLDDLLGP